MTFCAQFCGNTTGSGYTWTGKISVNGYLRKFQHGVPGVNVKKTSRVGNSLSHSTFFVSPETFTCVSVVVLLFLDR
jgi:hypothetical protein